MRTLVFLLLCAALSAQQRPQFEAGSSNAKKPPAGKAAKYQTSSLLDVNRATHAELLALPGLSALDVEHIEQGRPYKDKTELLSKRVLTKAQYTNLQSRLGPEPNTGAAVHKR